jgi:hypothetical protein
MNIALLWYGKQGKKHAQFWMKHWIKLEIFTRSWKEETHNIWEFIPDRYAIIICAIYPIEQQTILIQKILDSGYNWYLIIEKPVTLDMDLLYVLSERERTIFFIDEAYIDTGCDLNASEIFEIQTTSALPHEKSAVQEHAIGILLRSSIQHLKYDDVFIKHSTQGQHKFLILTDKYVFECNGNECKLNATVIISNFEKNYGFLIKNILNTEMLANIRQKYRDFRSNFFI